MSPSSRRKKRVTYSSVGVNRVLRESSRRGIASVLTSSSKSYRFGQVMRVPFGLLFPSPARRDYYCDLQIEGVGSKTLLAEITGDYTRIGIDAVAMAVNDVIRSGAEPFLLSDAIHISKSSPSVTRSLVEGVLEGAKLAGCVLASGETGDVPEILHTSLRSGSLPFDMMVSALGFVRKDDIIPGIISPGDVVIGLESSGIHSNGLTLARKILLKKWGGSFDSWDVPSPLSRPLVEEMLEPTRVYSQAISETRIQTEIKAAVHITGDGFAKFGRLIDWIRQTKGRQVGFQFENMGEIPAIFRLIYETSRRRKGALSSREMYQTFNMGFGFAVVVDKNCEDAVLDRLNKHCRAIRIGRVVQKAAILIEDSELENRRLILNR